MSAKHVIDYAVKSMQVKGKMQLAEKIFMHYSSVYYAYNNTMNMGYKMMVMILRLCPELTMKQIDELLALPHE